VLILQFVLRVGDAEAAVAVQYDQRWRLALHLGEDEATFHPTVLVVFRERIVESGQQSLAFEAVLDFLVKQGWIPKRSRQRLDSTHVWGLLRVMSRLERARETLRLWLEDLEAHDLLPLAWDHYWERYVESKLDHRAGVKALEAKLTEAGEDMLAIWLEAGPDWPLASRDSFLLLQQVFLENFEIDLAGPLKTHRAQPTGAVQNPHEPEAQWSSKSTTRDKAWIGYKVQVAETVQDEPRCGGEPTANFLTALVTQDAPDSDKAGLALVLQEQQEMGLASPETLYVDGAYISSEALEQAQHESRRLMGPAPAAPDRGAKVFTVEAFDVSVEERFAVCPAGQRNLHCRVETRSTGRVEYRFEWNRSLCESCPLNSQCVSAGQNHRTILVGERHTFLQARRREMQTDEFKQEMRRRNGIEGTQSELVRAYGLRRARYRGKAQVRLQIYLIGAACNIRRLFRRLQWESAQACPKTAALAG